MKINVKGVKCPHCLDIVYSRSHHDCRWCSCKRTMIDNGPHIIDDPKMEYMRVTQDAVITQIELEGSSILELKRELFQDWNSSLNLHGIIHG